MLRDFLVFLKQVYMKELIAGYCLKLLRKERKYKFNKNSLFYTQVRFLVVHNGEAKYREKIQNKTMTNYSTNESKFDNG